MRFDGTKNAARRLHVEEGRTVGLLHEVNGGPAPEAPLRFGAYRKTSLTYAARMEEYFEVQTLEGLHTGKAGDMLAIGAAGEMYPIDGAVFAATYEKTDG